MGTSSIEVTELAISAIPARIWFARGPAALTVAPVERGQPAKESRPSPSMTVSVAVAAATMDADGVIR